MIKHVRLFLGKLFFNRNLGLYWRVLKFEVLNAILLSAALLFRNIWITFVQSIFIDPVMFFVNNSITVKLHHFILILLVERNIFKYIFVLDIIRGLNFVIYVLCARTINGRISIICWNDAICYYWLIYFFLIILLVRVSYLL